MFLPKDFVETAEGLLFALVEAGTEAGKVLCFLRYVKEGSSWKKYPTTAANALLQQHFPEYLHYSPVLDTHLHAVPLNRIVKHHQPKIRLQDIMQAQGGDAVEMDLRQLGGLFKREKLALADAGVTGSILVGCQNPDSDIDLVCYGQAAFRAFAMMTRELIEQGRLQDLTDEDWLAAYDRRASSLTFAEYRWHERRKGNKALINGRKFDLSCVDAAPRQASEKFQKHGKITVQSRVTDDSRAFAYPAEFLIDHPNIHSVVSFTATYTGQAYTGEMIEVAGLLEASASGQRRIVVGSSREAEGEYIKVMLEPFY
jgi:hypothetical protein